MIWPHNNKNEKIKKIKPNQIRNAVRARGDFFQGGLQRMAGC